MKLRLLTAVTTAVLLLAPKTANALDTQGQYSAVASGQALMQNANESVQATTDMSFSDPGMDAPAASQAARNGSFGGIGGVVAGQSEMGSRRDELCTGGPQCKIYFGH
ncbi:hypothetical protein AAGS40_18255 [Paraburkholderia sp. PREW-6R]|uniref:hypothetical protein n=1 Tax=Paraburkholderia sp. PREW-6R TaxID=3141544 RepID=UPI0031F56331